MGERSEARGEGMTSLREQIAELKRTVARMKIEIELLEKQKAKLEENNILVRLIRASYEVMRKYDVPTNEWIENITRDKL
jgi:hypothetical protein